MTSLQRLLAAGRTSPTKLMIVDVFKELGMPAK